MAKAALEDEFRRNERVVVLDDLPGIPAGTAGKVLLVDGLSWIRYRVLFENGEDRGSLDASVLARPQDFERRRAAREAGAQATVAVAAGGEEESAEAAASGEAKAVNGVSVPGHLLERSKRARERLVG